MHPTLNVHSQQSAISTRSRSDVKDYVRCAGMDVIPRVDLTPFSDQRNRTINPKLEVLYINVNHTKGGPGRKQ